MIRATSNIDFIDFIGRSLKANGIKCVGHFAKNNSHASIEILGDPEMKQAKLVYSIVTNILKCTDRTQQALVNNHRKLAHKVNN